MQRLFGAVLFLALSTAIVVAQQPPPGADQVGSDHRVGNGSGNQSPTANPRVNADVTGTTGSSTGHTGEGVFGGNSGYNERTNKEESATGQQYDTRAGTRSATADKHQQGASNDNGSVWQGEQPQRKSNIVARMNSHSQNSKHAPKHRKSAEKQR